MSVDVAAVVGASSLSTACWLGGAGSASPQVRGAVTLTRGPVPVLAFTYADEAVAREVAASPVLAIAFTETRSTGRGFAPLLVRGRPRLVEDPFGEVFTEELLAEELRRFPPARVYADSPLLRREHWWYLPRLLVELEVTEVSALPAAGPGRDHLLVVAHGGGPGTGLGLGVAVAGTEVLAGVSGTGVSGADGFGPGVAGSQAAGRPAVLFGQDASFPDLERWSQWRYRGVWDGERLQVAEQPSRTGLAPAPGLLQRWRRERELERRCRRAVPRR